MTDYRDRLEAGEFDPERARTMREAIAKQSPGLEASKPLDELTKAELIERAQSLGVSPANASMSKEDLAAAIEAAS